MASPGRTALYVGVTSTLRRRVWKHRNKFYPDSFSARYNCVMLVYYNYFPKILEAIAEEKRLKAGSRGQKDSLIAATNPEFRDLWPDLEEDY